MIGGRVAIVTGASSGIGECASIHLARSGWRVICVGRQRGKLRAVQRYIEECGGTAKYGIADVTSEEDVREVFEYAQTCGNVSGVVHGAGILAGIGALVDIPLAEWKEAIETNLFGTMLSIKYGARTMMSQGNQGSVVVMGGGGASYGFPRYSAYAASKTAVVRLAETAAMELSGTKVRINVLAPGFLPTPIHSATLEAGPERAGRNYFDRTRRGLAAHHEDGMRNVMEAISTLLSSRSMNINGRFLSVRHDDIEGLVENGVTLDENIFRLRRETS